MADKDNLLDQFIAGVTNAVTDVREKVVEEPWFGRAVTDAPTAEVVSNTPSHWEDFVEQATRNAPASKDDIEPEPDHDIDR